MAKITLGITGSIAVQKTPILVKKLLDLGHEIFIVMTKSASVFGYDAELEQLVGADHFYTHEITTEVGESINHIYLAQEVDLLAIIPATYNSINKYALGLADDLLSSIVAAKTVPFLLAPAMNTKMYENSIVQKSLEEHRKAQAIIIPPAYGMLACGVEGIGRLAEIDVIVQEIQHVLEKKTPLQGKHVLISAGPTRVYIDPIRYISNTSSGQMGLSLALAAEKMGATVTLVIGPNKLSIPTTITTRPVETPEEMLFEMEREFPTADYVFMSAAVSDYKPKERLAKKLKKGADVFSLELVRSVDILQTLGQSKTHQCLIGFAAEDENHLENAKDKLVRKNLDFILLNDLAHFDKKENQLTLVGKTGVVTTFDKQEKTTVAEEILATIVGVRS